MHVNLIAPATSQGSFILRAAKTVARVVAEPTIFSPPQLIAVLAVRTPRWYSLGLCTHQATR